MKELLQPSKRAARLVLEKAMHILPVSAVSVLIFAGSGGGVGEKNSSPEELNNKESSAYSLPFPFPEGVNGQGGTIKAAVAEPKDPITSPAQSEGKISISKTPEDLYRTLASIPLLKKDLPSGMSVIGNPIAYSQSEINNMLKSFGSPPQPFSGGVINIRIGDERLSPFNATGFPDIILVLNIFTSNQDALAAYNESITQNEQSSL